MTPTYLPATRYGGPIYSVHALCAALVRAGHEVDVYTTNVDGPGVSSVPVEQAVWRDGVRVTYFEVGLGRRLYRAPQMAAAMRQNSQGFDIVHAHAVFLWPTAAAAAAARLLGVPYVISPRGMLVGDLIRRKSWALKSAWIAAFERRNMLGAAAIHVTSELEREEIRALGLQVRRFVVVGNGLDPDENFEPTDHNSGVLDNQTPGEVLCLGRINWKKGLDRLVAALPFAPNARLKFVGNDEDGYRPQIEELARRLGVLDRVVFHESVFGTDKWRMIRGAQVFALCSYSENFGNVVLEAMACGVPVLVTPEVGLAPMIEQSGAGLVVEGDAAKIGAAITHLLASPDLRARMGAAGREIVRAQFSWDRVAAAMVEHYAEAIAEARCRNSRDR